jgi:hypothetical protein
LAREVGEIDGVSIEREDPTGTFRAVRTARFKI